MEIESLMLIIKEYGYIALYFILWLGFFGLPVPNEVIVMTSGFITSKGLLQPLPGFIVTFAGVMSSLTTLYLLGRFSYKSIHTRLMRYKKIKEYIEKSEVLIEKYGPVALVVGYVFPGVRHFVPFLSGSHKMDFRKFAFYAYSTAFIWTLLLFSTGYFFGNNIEQIGEVIYSIGIIGVILIVLTFGTLILLKRKRARKAQLMSKE
ncbi:DedA family protein [Cytobacillus sp. S13-E01]|uniref:DedA family protein n=1 Tax=Cytobacillus sp. S13-E01 TaxID=3031326 RepID=UPI0023D7C7F4|nr:DedA family protein [Cytobacillus sp. S13-E01]MDF0728850.1 DedA family protein [Cytobacillus sp. S13-E01]